MTKREFDVVLYGASGFTGKQTVIDFKLHAPSSMKWAIAGRSKERLEAVLRDLGLSSDRVPILVADSQDLDELEKLAARTHVILSTAGPFSLYAPKLIQACVQQSTHWCDITGETPFIRQMIDIHHAEAREKGLKIVPACGFDSVPSDIGTLWAIHEVMKKTGRKSAEVRSFFTVKGGLNGGTLASARLIADRAEFKKVAHIFLLDPENTPHSDEEFRANADLRKPQYISALGKWAAPFFMAAINTRIVRRSVALFRENTEAELLGYSTQFRYNEMMIISEPFGFPLVTWMTTLGLAVFDGLIRTQFGGKLLDRVGPAPGVGPSEKAMNDGFSRTLYLVKDDTGQTHRFEMIDQGDPGNRITVRIVCECARLLAEESQLLPGQGGVLTPATAFGLKLVERLRARGTIFQALP